MAGLGLSGGDTLFVSPETLVIDNNSMSDTYQEEQLRRPQQYHHHHIQNVSCDGQQSQQSTSFAERQRPSLPNLNLPMHSLSDWNVPTQNSFRPQLPPTPLSPFRPLGTLTENDKMAFPCPGGPHGEDCWNIELCPKHRQYPDTPPKSDTESTQSNGRPAPPPNPRRRSAPTEFCETSSSDSLNSGHPPPCKMKRHATEPEEADCEISNSASTQRPSSHHRRTLSRDNSLRSSLSRGGRVPHNLVERRYRDNLNHQIESLRLTLPSLKDAQPSLPGSDFEDLSSPRMPSKAIIISTAATYIRDMENERARLLDANKALVEQVASLQKLVRCDEGNLLHYVNAMSMTAGQLPTPM